MFNFTADDLWHAFILLFFIQGLAYLLFPKAIQGFAIRCLVDANPANLRLFGAILIGAAFFFVIFLKGVIE